MEEVPLETSRHRVGATLCTNETEFPLPNVLLPVLTLSSEAHR